jgi:outer membrane protein OmpA-like peptidoglycan-associated protein
MQQQHQNNHQNDGLVVSNYTLTAIFSFTIIFCLLLLMSQCHGPFMVAGHHEETHNAHNEKHSTSHSTSEKLEPHETQATQQSVKLALANKVEVTANKGGIEDKLIAFINDEHQVASKSSWFDFDNINFNSGSATLTKESQPQLENIAAILKSYPKLSIKIGGYTDKSGDSLTNLKLSQTRAETVLNQLKTLTNNSAQIVAAEGYGSQFAKADKNANEEEKKKDRRIAIQVRNK